MKVMFFAMAPLIVLYQHLKFHDLYVTLNPKNFKVRRKDLQKYTYENCLYEQNDKQ